jgi:Glycosyltransferase sugar-binding region containing DXD motif
MQAVEMISDPEADAAVGRKIPKIVHMTGKTKCLTNDFFDAAKKWQFQNHSFYFHDDQAVDELFNRDWPMFPQLKNTLICLNLAGGGKKFLKINCFDIMAYRLMLPSSISAWLNYGSAAIADLWRYLALYEYVGIYTDMDNHPSTLFHSTSVDPNTDAYFLQERGGFLSQYFFAVSPKHPLMFLAVHDVMREMHNILDTGNFYVPVLSGPGAMKVSVHQRLLLAKRNMASFGLFVAHTGWLHLDAYPWKRAFLQFMGLNATNLDLVAGKYSKPPKGHYEGVGFGNHSVTVVASKAENGKYVSRSAVAGPRKTQGNKWTLQTTRALTSRPVAKRVTGYCMKAIPHIIHLTKKMACRMHSGGSGCKRGQVTAYL